MAETLDILGCSYVEVITQAGGYVPLRDPYPACSARRERHNASRKRVPALERHAASAA